MDEFMNWEMHFMINFWVVSISYQIFLYKNKNTFWISIFGMQIITHEDFNTSLSYFRIPEDDEEDVEAEVATSTASMRDGNDKGDHGIGEK